MADLHTTLCTLHMREDRFVLDLLLCSNKNRALKNSVLRLSMPLPVAKAYRWEAGATRQRMVFAVRAVQPACLRPNKTWKQACTGLIFAAPRDFFADEPLSAERVRVSGRGCKRNWPFKE